MGVLITRVLVSGVCITSPDFLATSQIDMEAHTGASTGFLLKNLAEVPKVNGVSR